MVAAASVSAAGCIQFGVKPLPYRVLASAAPGGVSPGFEETLLPLLTKAGAYVLTGEGEWQRLRDSLNLGTDAQLYGAIDFSRQVLLVFFHGLGASMGDRIIIRSLRAAGRRVTATLGLERGLLTAIGFPYTIIAVDRADLAGRGAEPAGPDGLGAPAHPVANSRAKRSSTSAHTATWRASIHSSAEWAWAMSPGP